MNDFETAPRGTLCEKEIKIDLLERQKAILMEVAGMSEEHLDRALWLKENRDDATS